MLRALISIDHPLSSAAGLLATNVFQHVAATYDKATGNAVLYLNGAVVAQQSLGIFTPLTTGDLYFGLRPYDGGAGTRFIGLMDEVSLYNRALSAAQIQAIYNAGSAGKCAVPIITSQPRGPSRLLGKECCFQRSCGRWPAAAALSVAERWHSR